MRALVLSLVLVTAAAAQAPAEPASPSPPTADVWLSFGPGVLVAGEGDAYDSLYGTLALQGARGPWTARLSYSETAVFQADISGLFGMATAAGASAQAAPRDGDPTVFRTVQLAAGPRATTDRSQLALIGGPALTQGGRRGGGSYSEVGVGVAGQAMLQLAGPVWVGAEASAVLNSGASHGGVIGVLRIDLVRANG